MGSWGSGDGESITIMGEDDHEVMAED